MTNIDRQVSYFAKRYALTKTIINFSGSINLFNQEGINKTRGRKKSVRKMNKAAGYFYGVRFKAVITLQKTIDFNVFIFIE